MELETFYAAVSQVSFTVLGLWWLVVELKHRVIAYNVALRRTATNISLYFLLPGGMSLGALLSAEARFVWRWTFLIAGVIGVYETTRLIMRSTGHSRVAWSSMALRWLALALYTLIVFVALAASVIEAWGAVALTIAGIAIALILILGVLLAWSYFIEPLPGE